MRKGAMLAVLTVLMLVGVVQAKEWYEGGTLHRATVGQYLQGPPDNVLATTADWVSATVAEAEIARLNMGIIKQASAAVALCVIQATDGIEAMYGQKASEIAVLCMSQLKGQYPWMLTR